MAHVLVIANETAPSRTLYDVLRERARAGDVTVTVIAPVNEPRHGYVVYENTRRSSAGRRLTKTLRHLRETGIPAQGFVVDTGPVAAVKDALRQIEPKPDEIIVSTHPPQKSGWTRRNVLEDIRRTAGDIPVEHVVAADEAATAEKNVLVVANQTILSQELLDKIRSRGKDGAASFLFVAPQSDGVAQPEADRRLRRALSVLRVEGIDVHGQVVHPDPYTAAMDAVNDERIDEIIVSTLPSARSGWMRRDLVERLRTDTGVPVEHVEASE